MDPQVAQTKLIRILQRAYSGELAAALAYRGHWRSLKDEQERAEVKQIEEDELLHREHLARMIAHLGAAPDERLERKMRRIGKTIGFLCHLGGWYIPMYGAGRLERSNIWEYEDAARFAHLSGHVELVDDLLTWAEKEWDHEKYFREKARTHLLRLVIPIWAPPPAKEAIRKSFSEFCRATPVLALSRQ